MPAESELASFNWELTDCKDCKATEEADKISFNWEKLPVSTFKICLSTSTPSFATPSTEESKETKDSKLATAPFINWLRLAPIALASFKVAYTDWFKTLISETVE